jgi:hypothetical protein
MWLPIRNEVEETILLSQGKFHGTDNWHSVTEKVDCFTSIDLV